MQSQLMVKCSKYSLEQNKEAGPLEMLKKKWILLLNQKRWDIFSSCDHLWEKPEWIKKLRGIEYKNMYTFCPH